VTFITMIFITLISLIQPSLNLKLNVFIHYLLMVFEINITRAFTN